MSCDAIAAAAFLWLAAGPATIAAPEAPPAVAHEPLFNDIITTARALKVEAEGYRTGNRPLAGVFPKRIGELARLDMEGHTALAKRGVDGDLKCILKGIAEDLPLKLSEVQAAADPKARDRALRDMVYLLNDNVEVITAPPKPPV